MFKIDGRQLGDKDPCLFNLPGSISLSSTCEHIVKIFEDKSLSYLRPLGPLERRFIYFLRHLTLMHKF